jgi:thiosulfate/3-mercaptopyruvate sulfurtransferase
MAIGSNKYRIGISFVIIGLAAIGAALATICQPAPDQRAAAPAPQEPRAVPQPPAKHASANADRAPFAPDGTWNSLLSGKPGLSTSRVKPAAEEAPSAPSMDYAPGLLVNPLEFKDPQFAKRAQVLDARFWDYYLPRHISGSLNTDAKEWVTAFSSDPSQPAWEKRIGALGLDRNAPVVICDDGANKDAASVRAILRYWGFTDVRLLNGGWHAWVSAGGPRDGKTPHPIPQTVHLSPVPGQFIAKEQLLEMLQDGNAQIVDACNALASQPSAELRSAVQNNGGVKQFGWSSIVTSRHSPTFSARDLERLVRAAGIDVTQPTVVYSESLGDAAGVAFALELLGARNVQIYSPVCRKATVASAATAE